LHSQLQSFGHVNNTTCVSTGSDVRLNCDELQQCTIDFCFSRSTYWMIMNCGITLLYDLLTALLLSILQHTH